MTKKKPDIITAYNSTKGGDNTSDWMAENYSVTRKSSRWPLTIFYALLNIGGINPQIIFRQNTKNSMTRLTFLKTLGRDLMEDQLRYRSTIISLPLPINNKLNIIYSKPTQDQPQRHVRAQGRCSFCERSKDRKATKVCTTYVKNICRDHLIEICPDCYVEQHNA